MASKKPPNIARFLGLNNVTDPLRLGLGWLRTADNVDITDTGAIKKRVGYTRSLGAAAITGAYATEDFSRLYFVDSGNLKAMAGSGAVTLVTGMGSAPLQWTEINEQVFFTNGAASGIICPDNTVLPWAWAVPGAPTVSAVTGTLPAGLYQVRITFTLPDGRMTGASESTELVLTEGQALQIAGIAQAAGCTTNVYIAPADSEVYGHAATPAGSAMVWNEGPETLGRELQGATLDPLPEDVVAIQAWRGRIYAAQYMPEAGQTAIFRSQPLGFHLFDLAQDLILIPGKVTMLAPQDAALVIGTDQSVLAYDGDKLIDLAGYGVIPGQHWAKDEDDGRVLFWSARGLCAALPFANLTEQQVSVAPGLRAGGTLVRFDGQKRFVVAIQQGGNAFNPRL